MREIKYRAWDKFHKRFGYVVLHPDSIGWPSFSWLESEMIELVKGDGFVGIKFDNVEGWQEFTGLHDKNGKEIYEGDVVKFDGHTRDEKFTSEIICDQGMFRPKEWSEPLGFYKYKEVIGNIYENPELLKEK